MVISITSATYIEGYRIKFRFSDKTEKIIDFSDFLLNARNPMTRKYLDKEYFKAFSVEYGDLVWNDYELCFPIWDLHEGRL